MAVHEVARAYWAHYERTVGGGTDRVGLPGGDEDLVDAVDHAVQRGGRDAVELIAVLAAAAPDDAALAYLGAGPMEDLLGTHGSSVVDAIDGYARRDARVRYALRCAWYEGSLPAEIVTRLRRYGDPP